MVMVQCGWSYLTRYRSARLITASSTRRLMSVDVNRILAGGAGHILEAYRRQDPANHSWPTAFLISLVQLF
jgi:hypothetical protein